MRQSQPDPMSAFGALAAAGAKDGALTKKTRGLIALGIGISCRCGDCIGFDMQSPPITRKATREEVEEAAGVAVYMGGGTSMMYAAHTLMAVGEPAA
ncbi:carboxymuconolactone decarboxylase family protein [Burkholderia thailandensis]|uniref:carboxymuconolactone decarboxylase family protein n=1 Tax=Burkholderia thailandensis TaxID=57975 RepID=UPI0022ABE2AC|nr:carboxymuconolactone decarboxylase family protein [Burkholderia thailandensis]MCZ2896830.1 carboxymuconolactone decarboxylase family protein [Burkholderia thailandensis]